MQKQATLLLTAMKQAVINFQTQELISLCEEYLNFNLDPYKAVFEGLVPGMLEVGELYEQQTYFIPEMLLCAETLYAGLEIFQPYMSSLSDKKKGKILIGVVEGDVHDVGKNLVKMMFQISDYDVTDLGRDVSTNVFLQRALEEEYDMICMSSMMTTTMYEMKGLIKKLKEKKPNLKVMIGGSPVTKLHAIKWHADGYAADAKNAVTVVEQLINAINVINEKR